VTDLVIVVPRNSLSRDLVGVKIGRVSAHNLYATSSWQLPSKAVKAEIPADIVILRRLRERWCKLQRDVDSDEDENYREEEEEEGAFDYPSPNLALVSETSQLTGKGRGHKRVNTLFQGSGGKLGLEEESDHHIDFMISELNETSSASRFNSFSLFDEEEDLEEGYFTPPTDEEEKGTAESQRYFDDGISEFSDDGSLASSVKSSVASVVVNVIDEGDAGSGLGMRVEGEDSLFFDATPDPPHSHRDKYKHFNSSKQRSHHSAPSNRLRSSSHSSSQLMALDHLGGDEREGDIARFSVKIDKLEILCSLDKCPNPTDLRSQRKPISSKFRHGKWTSKPLFRPVLDSSRVYSSSRQGNMQVWRSVTSHPWSLTTLVDFIPEGNLRILLDGDKFPHGALLIQPSMAEFYLLQAVWFDNCQEDGVLFPSSSLPSSGGEDDGKDGKSFEDDSNENKSDEDLRYKANKEKFTKFASPRHIKMICEVVPSWEFAIRCPLIDLYLFFSPGDFIEDPDSLKYVDSIIDHLQSDSGTASLHQTSFSDLVKEKMKNSSSQTLYPISRLRLGSIVCHMLGDADTFKLAAGAGNMELIDARVNNFAIHKRVLHCGSDAISSKLEALMMRDLSIDSVTGVEGYADLDFGLDIGSNAISTPQDLPLKVSLFMTPNNWIAINVALDHCDVILRKLELVWVLVDYFADYYSQPKIYQNSRNDIERGIANLSKFDEEEQLEQSSEPEGGIDVRVWITRPHIALIENSKTRSSQTLVLETDKGVYYRYRAGGMDSLRMEIRASELALILLRSYSLPCHIRDSRGTSGSGRGVRTIAEWVSASVVYDFITSSNITSLKVIAPYYLTYESDIAQRKLISTYGFDFDDVDLRPDQIPTPTCVTSPLILSRDNEDTRTFDVVTSADDLVFSINVVFSFLGFDEEATNSDKLSAKEDHAPVPQETSDAHPVLIDIGNTEDSLSNHHKRNSSSIESLNSLALRNVMSNEEDFDSKSNEDDNGAQLGIHGVGNQYKDHSLSLSHFKDGSDENENYFTSPRSAKPLWVKVVGKNQLSETSFDEGLEESVPTRKSTIADMIGKKDDFGGNGVLESKGNRVRDLSSQELAIKSLDGSDEDDDKVALQPQVASQVHEESSEGAPYIIHVIGQVSGARIIFIDPILGMHLPIAKLFISNARGIYEVDRHRTTRRNSRYLSASRASSVVPAPNSSQKNSLQQPSEVFTSVTASASVRLWGDYFNNTLKCWEPLIEPVGVIALYEQSRDRGVGINVSIPCRLHVNVTGAFLRTLDDALKIVFCDLPGWITIKIS